MAEVRPLMNPKLLQAAIEGDEQVLTEMLGLEEGRDGQVNVRIDDVLEFGPHNHLQSATFMGNTVLHVLCSNDHDALASKICNKDTSLLKARNKMLETPLHCAAKGGCTGTVSTLLKFGAEAMVRERNCHGETALHEAARHNHEGVIEELMTVDPELAYEVDNYGVSALEVALARGNTEMMEKLSDQSINSRICSSRPDCHNYMENTGNAQKPINMWTVDILGSPPIHLVASVGNTHGAKLLLQNDASLAYLQDSDGLFPIHVAARMGHVEMVILFMQRYLDSGELLDLCGRNFLHIAAKENKFNIFIRLFIKLFDNELLRGIEKFNADELPPLWEGMLTRMINSVDNNGNTPLHLAAEKAGKLVEILMKIGEVDNDIRNRRGLTPFDLLVIQVKESNKNSQHIQSATFMGNTVLHVLCSNDHAALASKICNKDTSLLKARNKMLETPLHCAVKGGCTRTVSTLLKFGAEAMVRERNCHGETALHEAARHNHEGIIEELMKIDSELAYEVDNYGISALEVSLARGNNEMVNKLSGQKINSRIWSSRPDRHNYMENTGNAQKKINISTVDILGSPPIHLVASVGNTDGAKLLLQNDASLAYLQDSDGLFPIHVAAPMGHVEMVILFMQRYLDSGELLDHCGRNFLHIAAKENKFNIFIKLFLKFNNAYELRWIEKLNNNGLPPLWHGMLTRMINSVDNNGNTPLHLAVEKGGKLVETLTKIDEVDQDIRNRRGLRPFDLLVIEVKESAENSQDLADQIEKYVRKKGARITSGWFDKSCTLQGHPMNKKAQVIS
ncbi:hypothetical protein LUZ60_010716 [Juncus effusus]|nr:hypothetical protein LUZ60_010716 [Juncus effusus]